MIGSLRARLKRLEAAARIGIDPEHCPRPLQNIVVKCEGKVTEVNGETENPDENNLITCPCCHGIHVLTIIEEIVAPRELYDQPPPFETPGPWVNHETAYPA